MLKKQRNVCWTGLALKCFSKVCVVSWHDNLQLPFRPWFWNSKTSSCKQRQSCGALMFVVRFRCQRCQLFPVTVFRLIGLGWFLSETRNGASWCKRCELELVFSLKWKWMNHLWYVSDMNEMNEAWIVSQNALAESHTFYFIIILSSCCRLKKLWWTCSRSFSVEGSCGVPICIILYILYWIVMFLTGTQCPGLLLAPVPTWFNLGHHSALFDRWA